MRISDWSSDVCSSDLGVTSDDEYEPIDFVNDDISFGVRMYVNGEGCSCSLQCHCHDSDFSHLIGQTLSDVLVDDDEVSFSCNAVKIGRASCRERVCKYV